MRDEKDKPQQDLKARTRQFALRIIRVFIALPTSTLAQVLGKQMLRAGTLVGAHYREAFRSRSDAEFISKLEGGLQELDETEYWLELLMDAGVIPAKRLTALSEGTQRDNRNLHNLCEKSQIETKAPEG